MAGGGVAGVLSGVNKRIEAHGCLRDDYALFFLIGMLCWIFYILDPFGSKRYNGYVSNFFF